MEFFEIYIFLLQMICLLQRKKLSKQSLISGIIINSDLGLPAQKSFFRSMLTQVWAFKISSLPFNCSFMSFNLILGDLEPSFLLYYDLLDYRLYVTNN